MGDAIDWFTTWEQKYWLSIATASLYLEEDTVHHGTDSERAGIWGQGSRGILKI